MDCRLRLLSATPPSRGTHASISRLTRAPHLAMPSSRTDIRQKSGDWVPYSKQLGGLAVAPNVRTSAQRPFGKASFTAHFVGADGVTPISPWHDLELYPTGAAARIVNFVCEIPRGTTAKLEVQKRVPQNPIMQDIKKGALRYYTYGPTFFNYGMLSRYLPPWHHFGLYPPLLIPRGS